MYYLGGLIILWKLKEGERVGVVDEPDFDAEATEDKEYWQQVQIIRLQDREDVFDLAWSPCGKFLLVGTSENAAIIFDSSTGIHLSFGSLFIGKMVKTFKDHRHYVQGVAWDPWDGWLATQSADRNVRLWKIIDRQKNNNSSSSNQTRRTISLLNKINKTETGTFCFHDESLVTFFRRLCFTPDGAYLLMPSGMDDLGETKNSSVLVLSRTGFSSMQQPAASLNGFKKPPVSVRCCPRLFELIKEDTEGQQGEATSDQLASNQTSSPYRTIFAAASRSTINIYDTQYWGTPICSFSNLHYGTMTDVAWSADGRVLVMASQDGFCSIAWFLEGELGKELGMEREKEVLADVKHRIHMIETANSVASISILSSDPIVDVQEPENSSTLNDNLLTNTMRPVMTASQVPAKRRLAPILIGTPAGSTFVLDQNQQ